MESNASAYTRHKTSSSEAARSCFESEMFMGPVTCGRESNTNNQNITLKCNININIKCNIKIHKQKQTTYYDKKNTISRVTAEPLLFYSIAVPLNSVPNKMFHCEKLDDTRRNVTCSNLLTQPNPSHGWTGPMYISAVNC